MTILIRVDDTPRPGGSKNARAVFRRDGTAVLVNGRPILSVQESGKYTKAWRSSVRDAAREVFDGEPLTCLLAVRFVFEFVRPKSHFRTGRNAHLLRDDAPQAPGVKPDTTKLIRSTEDALSGIVWKDDALIVRQFAEKRYAAKPGATIEIREYEPDERVAEDWHKAEPSLFEGAMP